MPPMPVNYDDLLNDVRQWIASLDGCQADVRAAQQAAGQQAADSAAQLAAADEAADPEAWHRLSWLRWGLEAQQGANTGSRFQAAQEGFGSSAMPARAALRALPKAWCPCQSLTRSQQHPLVEERLQGLGGRLEAMPAAAAALQGLVQHIEEEKVGGQCLAGTC